MREADRPSDERLSVLDRPRTDEDALPPHLRRLGGVDETTVRLALVVDDRRMYIGRGAVPSAGVDDAIFQFFVDSHGAGSGGGPRSVLISHGATVACSWNQHRSVVRGIVPDPVTAVRIGAVEAIVANNAFLADVRSRDDRIVLTTPDGERVVPRPRVPRLADRPTTREVDETCPTMTVANGGKR